jgi:electron transfer flavoprotein-quinone oxidoreductase
MAVDKIDAVVVGGGLAGLAAAYRLAESGRQVIVLERGDQPGSKNVTGGRMYVEPIRHLFPLIEHAPFERHVVKELITVLDDQDTVQLEYIPDSWRRPPYPSHTVLRARLDKWLSDKAMERGAFVIPKRRVDDLLWEDGRVAGVVAGGEEIWAHIVIAADGALSFMADKAGLRAPLAPNNYAVAVKEIYKLDEKIIEERFGLDEGEGAANLFVGAVTKGLFGGGFLYTNKDTLSLGLVLGMSSLMKSHPSVETHSLMEAFAARPEIARRIKGAELKEYSAHIISEAGLGGISKLYTEGMLVAGDAAGFALNVGITVRGMEFAIASGAIAAETANEALEKGDTSAATLAEYEKRLRGTFVLKDMETFRHSREVLENERLFTVYPKFLCTLLGSLLTVDDKPQTSLYQRAMGVAKEHILNWQGMKDFISIRRI